LVSARSTVQTELLFPRPSSIIESAPSKPSARQPFLDPVHRLAAAPYEPAPAPQQNCISPLSRAEMRAKAERALCPSIRSTSTIYASICAQLSALRRLFSDAVTWTCRPVNAEVEHLATPPIVKCIHMHFKMKFRYFLILFGCSYLVNFILTT
jgi:hypothetical protein